MGPKNCWPERRASKNGYPKMLVRPPDGLQKHSKWGRALLEVFFQPLGWFDQHFWVPIFACPTLLPTILGTHLGCKNWSASPFGRQDGKLTFFNACVFQIRFPQARQRDSARRQTCAQFPTTTKTAWDTCTSAYCAVLSTNSGLNVTYTIAG